MDEGILFSEHAGISGIRLKWRGSGYKKHPKKEIQVGVSRLWAQGPESDTVPRVFKGQWPIFGGCYGWRVAQSVSVANVNRDDSRWNANVNRLGNDNRWNVDNRLLVRNKSYFLPSHTGVFFSTYTFHPTSILLASTKSPAIRRY